MQSQDSESGQCNLEIAKFSDCTEQMKGLEPEWSIINPTKIVTIPGMILFVTPTTM